MDINNLTRDNNPLAPFLKGGLDSFYILIFLHLFIFASSIKNLVSRIISFYSQSFALFIPFC